MYSIKTKTTNEIIIKKSRFIGIAIPVFEESEILNILKIIKKEFLGANHYTYAYVIGDTGRIQKASDDGEPTRTAGFPILEVLHKHNLTNIIVIVIRYFGGIKLGAGGLIRAYSSSASEVLKLVTLTKKVTTYKCTLKCSYDYLGDIDKYIRENTELLDVSYDQEITFMFSVISDNYESVKDALFNKNHYTDRLEILEQSSKYA